MTRGQQLALGAEPKSKRPAASSMGTDELLARLRRHYLKPGAFPGGVFITEVGVNGTMSGTAVHSGGKVRRCDALHVGFTSTSGRVMRGHELKTSRADWLHELAQPGKADQWADQCHEWWVVAPNIEVVRPEELPPDWGLLVPGVSRTAMVAKVKARTHHEREPSWWAVRSMLARNDTLMERTIEERVASLLPARVDEALRMERRHAAAVATRHTALASALDAALNKAGLSYAFGQGELVDAVLATLRGKRTDSVRGLAVTNIDQAINALNRVREQLTTDAQEASA